jgi:hypothetical protein
MFKAKGFRTVLTTAVMMTCVVTACSSVAAPTPAPASAPTEVPDSTAVHGDSTTYTSPHYGYAVDYPTTWMLTPAQRDSTAYEGSYPNGDVVNNWAAPTSDPWVQMFVLAQPLADGQTASVRIAQLDAENADNKCQLGNRRDVIIAGVAARQEDGMCFGSDYISEIAVVHSGTFYFVYLLSGSPFSDASLATFDTFVKSFRFLKGS